MAYRKNKYRNGKSRGGTPGRATDTGFGAKGNLHKSKRNYKNVKSSGS